tara:strand:+ start:9851 stop:10918 length:1068 start_codon:yes stop_codon:yes gene_type:complete
MIKLIHILLFFSVFDSAFAVYRNGTTALNFLEIDVASSRVAMGGAGVSSVNDASATYWNPGGLAFVNKSDILFFNQSWIADISHTYTSIAIPIQGSSVIGLSLNVMNYGDIEVTTLEFQDGVGEYYTALDYSAGISYARKFVQWFGFGATFKYINSQIWHSNASAASVDLGVQIYTNFLSSKDGMNDGVKLGMSISNYGTRVKYDGLDLLQPIDPDDDYGNFGNVMGQYKTSNWELPLIFRIGISNNFINLQNHKLNIAIDAIHPNNDKERLNIGAEYSFSSSKLFNFHVRAGYKGIHIEGIKDSKIRFSSPFGPSCGFGVSLPIEQRVKLKADYAVRFVGVFGMVKLLTIGLEF